MLGGNYDENYDVVLNHVVDHINYDGAGSNCGDDSVGDDVDGANENENDDDDINYDDNDD
jgi:hypothetical protein